MRVGKKATTATDNSQIRTKRKGKRVGRRPYLTDKQVSVIDFYFGEAKFNKAEAMRLAGYAVTSTGSNQWRLFEDTPLFAEEVERRRQLMCKKVELNEDWVVQKILLKAAANLGEILRKLEDHDNNLDCLSPDELYVITEFTSETRWEGRGKEKEKVQRLRVKSESGLKALDMLMRKLGAYNDKVEVNGELGILDALRSGRERMNQQRAKEEE